MKRSRVAALAVALAAVMVFSGAAAYSLAPPRGTAAAPTVSPAPVLAPAISVPPECQNGNDWYLASCAVWTSSMTDVCLLSAFEDCGSTSQSQSTELEMLELLTEALGNGVNASVAQFDMEIQTLGTTQYYMDDAADAAALAQLNNSSFTPALALADTVLPAEVTTIADQAAYILGAEWNTTNKWLWSNYASGARYHGSSGSYTTVDVSLSGTCPGASSCSSQYYYAGGVEMNETGTVQAPYWYVQQGADFSEYCSQSSDQALFKVAYGFTDSPFGKATAGTSGYPYNTSSFTQPSAVFVDPSTGSSGCELQGFGVYPLPNGGTTAYPAALDIAEAPSPYNPLNAINGQVSTALTSSISFCVVPKADSSCTYEVGGKITVPTGLLGVALTKVDTYLLNAETSAQTYWSFLKDQGYNTESAIPANCIIPPPAFSLPSDLGSEINNLTVNQSLALYDSWLNGIATFYDTPQNSTTFCTGHAQWKGPGTSAWGDANVNLTGFVYIPGEKLLANGTLATTNLENFSNRSSWTLNGSTPTWSGGCAGSLVSSGKSSCAASTPVPFTAWPDVGTVNLRIGNATEVPANDPITVVPLAVYQDWRLTGNGTDVVLTVNPDATAGDAVYVTSCEVGGAVETTNCTLTYQTIQQVLPNITCTSACKNNSAGSAFLNIPNPFGLLGAWLGKLFGNAGLGALVADLILVGLVLLLVYVCVVAVEGWGAKKKSGGSGGSGGTTVVVTGGSARTRRR